MNKTLKERAKELYDNLFNSAPRSKCEREVHFEMALFIKELAEATESGPEPVAFITREGITASKKQVETNTASTLTSSFTIPLYTTPPAPSVPDGWESELLGWVSACQSAYHIDSTPGHRFGGLGSNLEENRTALVEYVRDLLAAQPQPEPPPPKLSDERILKIYAEVRGRPVTMGKNRIIDFARAVEREILGE